MPCRFKALLLLAIGLGCGTPLPSQALVHHYVSFSMPETQLKAALKAAGKGRDDIILFRGLPASGGFQSFIRQLIPLIGDLPQGERPRIRIDPKAFEQAAIERVPVVIEGSDRDIRQARYPVMENDPRRSMRGALSKMTVTRWQEALLKENPREKRPPYPRPSAETPFMLEPVYRLPRALKGTEGGVIAAEGQRANALDVFQGPIALLVMDPMDPLQTQSILKSGDALKGSTLLLAGLRPGERDPQLTALMKTFPVPTYPVPEHWLQQLRITQLPATVSARGTMLEVRPWSP